MKVKDLIEKLEKYDLEKEVVIRFALDNEDEIGYVLIPNLLGIYIDDVAIYSSYEATKEDCDFVGQIDLKEAYHKMLDESEDK